MPGVDGADALHRRGRPVRLLGVGLTSGQLFGGENRTLDQEMRVLGENQEEFEALLESLMGAWEPENENKGLEN